MKLQYKFEGYGEVVYAQYGMPTYKTEQAAGFDLRAAIADEVVVPPVYRPGWTAAWPTTIHLGIAPEVPEGYELQLRARSGLGGKYGITLANGVGTIDPDFRGEMKAMLVNLGPETYRVQPGERIVQAVIAPIVQADLELVRELSATERGDSGLGGTGGL